LPELSLDGFKRWLVIANRNQQLALARADMVEISCPAAPEIRLKRGQGRGQARSTHPVQ
jgi:hypothetical protein